MIKVHSCNNQNSKSEKKDSVGNEQKPKKHDVPYLLNSSDTQERVRLLSQHEALKIACGGKNFEAPVHEQLEKGVRVLDSACGPGAWALEMSDQYPQSTFYALDIEQKYEANIVDVSKNNNCKFVCANVLNRLPFPDNYFDYIHQRLIVFGVRARSWPRLLRELMRILKPGGWIELNEAPPNDIFNIGPKLASISKCMKKGTIAKGFRISISRELEGYLLNSGAMNIEAIPIILSLDKNNVVGKVWCTSFLYGLYHDNVFRPMVAKEHPQMKDDQHWYKYLSEIENECVEYKSAALFFRYYAQKPFKKRNFLHNYQPKKRRLKLATLINHLFS